LTGRTLIGDFGGGDYRIRASKPGYDVTAALEPERLAFDSAWLDSAVIIDRGVITLPAYAGPGTGFADVNFSPALDAVPFVIYYRVGSSDTLLIGSSSTTNTSYFSWFALVSTSQLRFVNVNTLPAITIGYIVLKGPQNV
jgi:hypothetical protein